MVAGVPLDEAQLSRFVTALRWLRVHPLQATGATAVEASEALMHVVSQKFTNKNDLSMMTLGRDCFIVWGGGVGMENGPRTSLRVFTRSNADYTGFIATTARRKGKPTDGASCLHCGEDGHNEKACDAPWVYRVETDKDDATKVLAVEVPYTTFREVKGVSEAELGLAAATADAGAKDANAGSPDAGSKAQDEGATAPASTAEGGDAAAAGATEPPKEEEGGCVIS